MTTRIACASTAFLTATTWAAVDATSLLIAQSNTTLTTSYVASQGSTTGVITIDGIAVGISSRAGSPTGTMSVHLAVATVEVAGTLVTVNVSDLPTCATSTATTSPDDAGNGGWFFLKFAAPVTLLAATSYTVEAKTSSASQVALYRDATAGNWAKLLRTTTTGAPAAGDDLIITKEWTAAATGTARTVTMDETAATDYGGNTTSQITPALAITQGGTLTFDTTINSVLRLSGYLIVYNGGTLNIGTTGTPVQRGKTAILEFDCAADGDFGIVVRNGGTLTSQGLSRTIAKTIMKTKLTANAAVAATTMTVADDTGWLNGDQIFISTTSRTGTQAELRTLDADATATGLSISVGLTNAHLGTSPTQAYVGLLTQNVKIRSVSTTFMTFVYLGGVSTSDFDFTEVRYAGANIANKRGINVDVTTGSVAVSYCSIHDNDGAAFYSGNAAGNNFTLEHCSMYNNGVVSIAYQVNVSTTTGTNWTINDVIVCLCSTSGGGFFIDDAGGVFTNCVAAGGGGIGMNIGGAGTLVSFIGHEVFGCSGTGMSVGASLTGTVTVKAWRNNNPGFSMNSNATTDGKLTLLNCECFGNLTASYSFGNYIGQVVMDNCSGHGDTTFSTTHSINVTGQMFDVTILNCDFSHAAGIKVASTNDISIPSPGTNFRAFADNTYFEATNVIGVGNAANMTANSFLRSQRQDRTDGKHRAYYPQGNILTNAVTFNTAAPSEEMQPSSASVKLESGPELTACNSGSTVTVSVYVRKDGTYNGNAPRLILKRQDSMGVAADTVLDTLTVAANNWELLTGTTGAALEDGAFEFVVDCDGTAGSVFVDDWGATSP